MTYRYHPELQELVDDPAGFPPAEKFVGTLEEMRAFADPLYAEMRDLPLAEGVVARDVEIETADDYPMRARWYRKEGVGRALGGDVRPRGRHDPHGHRRDGRGISRAMWP